MKPLTPWMPTLAMTPWRALGALCWLCALVPSAGAENIEQVMSRSQQMRLAAFKASDASAAPVATLQADFERLKRELAIGGSGGSSVDLRVVDAGSFAEAIEDRTVVVNAVVADLPEICRLFVLAHELGHIAQDHWAQRVQLYRRHIPGEVVQQQTDAIAGVLGRDASRQAHRHEHSADGFAMRALLAMGYTRDELLAMFFRLGNHSATATHPGTGQRLAHLRVLDSESQLAMAPDE